MYSFKPNIMKSIIKYTALAAWIVLSVSKLNAQVNLANGLIAHYPFNGNANDASGNGYDLIMSGISTNSAPMLATDRFGNSNSAYHFDINTQLFTTPIPAFNSISVSLWFRASNIAIGAHYPTLIDFYDNIEINTIKSSFGMGHAIKPYQPTSGQNVNATININHTSSQTNISTSTNSATVDTWYHVVSTYDYGTNVLKIYQNGQFINQINVISSIKNITDLMIGSGHSYSNNTLADFTTTGLANYMTGSIDDIRIYNRALNSDEVIALYDNYVPNFNCNIKPIITIIGAQLATTSITGVQYQWYYNNTTVAGLNSNTYNRSNITGAYKVSVTANKCTSASDQFNLLVPPPNVVTVTTTQIVTITSVNTIRIYECPTLTGTNSNVENGRIEVYPNPNSGSFSISTQNMTISTIEIEDIRGYTLKKFNSEKELNISELPRGMYILKVYAQEGLVKAVKIMLE